MMIILGENETSISKIILVVPIYDDEIIVSNIELSFVILLVTDEIDIFSRKHSQLAVL